MVGFGGIFLFDMVIDFGIVNMLVYVKGKGIILFELLVVVYYVKDGVKKVFVVGEDVKLMFGWIFGSIEVICLMCDGVIVDFDIVEEMIKYFICKVYKCIIFLKLKIVVCVFYGVILVEKCVICQLVLFVGVWCVGLIVEFIVVVIGVGMFIIDLIGLMVVDIGGGIIEVVVLLLGDIVYVCLVCVGGDCMDEVIINYLCCQYNLLIGEVIVECIKISIGIVCMLDDGCGSLMQICGCDLLNGVLKEIEIS